MDSPDDLAAVLALGEQVGAAIDVLHAAGWRLCPPGSVVVRLPEPRTVPGDDERDPDDAYAVFGGIVDVPIGLSEVWPNDDASANGPWTPDEAEGYGLALLAAARWCATSPAEPTEVDRG